MNDKPDWFLRLVLVVILLVLAAHVAVEYLQFRTDKVGSPVGRYVLHPSEHSVLILDTRTGTTYGVGSDGKLIQGNMVELAAKQKK